MEGFRQQDELKNLSHKLPPMNSRMALRTPLEAPLHELEPTQLEVLQLSLNSKDLQTLFDRTELTDLRTAEVVLELMKRGYLQPR
jgi:hypothetical protein